MIFINILKYILLFLNKIFYLFAYKQKKIIRTNLKFIYGEKIDEKQITQISKECFRNMIETFISLLAHKYKNPNKLKKYVKFNNIEIINNFKKSNTPMILISAHYSNMESLAYFMGNYLIQTTHVARDLNNEFANKIMKKNRQYTKLNIVDKSGAVKYLVKALKSKQSVSLIVDQNTAPKDGSVIKFMGKDAIATNTPAFLSRKFNAPIVPFFMDTNDNINYEITFYEPIYCDNTNNKALDIQECTQKQATIIEKVIYNKPKLWFWCHKRWKNTFEHIYK